MTWRGYGFLLIVGLGIWGTIQDFSHAGETGKPFNFTAVAFRLDNAAVTMSPVYGKVYGQIGAIIVEWTIPTQDSLGKWITESDAIGFQVRGDLRAAYYQAKNLFREKQDEVLDRFETYFLPPEEKMNKQQKK